MEGSEGGEALTIIRQEMAQISAQMLTKADTGNLLHEFRTVVREEISALRTDLAAVEVRHGGSWLRIRWPDDVPPLLRTLRIPPVRLRNWLLETPLAPRGRPADRDAKPASTQAREPPARLWGGHAEAEE
ncbi:Hypothetical predicted protein [Pelobates cultripes]|uniref:Uncharacterized protein n=1 Tax=Pelobates cultripes TaxID=61616 RepID=A0AAD1RIC1_PELCU|nr:Hypothetical predicted protein [Pelobates cultripes]